MNRRDAIASAAAAWTAPLLLLLGRTARADAGDDWYTPKAEDFRPEYDRDAKNRGRQTWDQYWGWVGDFYRGNLLSAGWTRQGRRLSDALTSEETRRTIRAKLNDLGKEICREWAKDNAVRKVDTAALSRWGRSMEAAKSRDGGTGEEILRSIEVMRQEYEKMMKG